jgi:hypothetical protein
MQQVYDESHVTYHNHNRPSLWQVMATTPTPTSCLTAHGLSLIKTKALSSSNYCLHHEKNTTMDYVPQKVAHVSSSF